MFVGIFQECSFEEPLCLDAVLVMHLTPPNSQPNYEQSAHEALSGRFTKTRTVQLNPFVSAQLADSKKLALAEWEGATATGDQSFDFTPFVAMGANVLHQLSIALEQYCKDRLRSESFPLSIVVKPDCGTEGHLCRLFHIRALHDSPFFSCVRHIRAIILTGTEALLQPKRGQHSFSHVLVFSFLLVSSFVYFPYAYQDIFALLILFLV